MKYMKTLIVFVVVLAAGAYIYFFEKKVPTTEEKKRKADKIFDFEIGQVTKLSLKKGDRLIVCEKEGKDWKIIKPSKAEADGDKVGRIISTLKYLRAERQFESEKDDKLKPADFGLDKPVLSAVIDAGGVPLVFLLGDNCPAGRSMYAMLQGEDKILVVRKSIFNNLDKNVKDLRKGLKLEKKQEERK